MYLMNKHYRWVLGRYNFTAATRDWSQQIAKTRCHLYESGHNLENKKMKSHTCRINKNPALLAVLSLDHCAEKISRSYF